MSPITLTSLHLEAAGLIALADLRSLSKRTAITGTSSYLDTLFLSPGIHTQQSASDLNNGEYPPTAALNSGFVFRVENQATIRFLQSIGKTGCLTNAVVEPERRSSAIGQRFRRYSHVDCPGLASSLLYLLGPALTITVLSISFWIHDWWAQGIILILMLARLCNIIVIRRRCELGWKGKKEDGEGDLLVLLSQDRWVRLRGTINDIKTVTSGQWLRDTNEYEDWAVGLGTTLVYLAAAFANNVSPVGSLLLLCLLLVSAGILGLSNSLAESAAMLGLVLRKQGDPKKYERRLLMAEDLIKETGRWDWALALGLIPSEKHVFL